MPRPPSLGEKLLAEAEDRRKRRGEGSGLGGAGNKHQDPEEEDVEQMNCCRRWIVGDEDCTRNPVVAVICCVLFIAAMAAGLWVAVTEPVPP